MTLDFDFFVQLWIIVFSGCGAMMIARTDWMHRWGHVAGLLATPAYVYTTLVSGQWAMLILSFWYAWNFVVGIRNRFWSK